MTKSTEAAFQLEVHVKPEVYEPIRKAPELEGVSIPESAISAAVKVEAERRDRMNLLRLAEEDLAILADTLLRGPQPHTELYKTTAALHARFVR